MYLQRKKTVFLQRILQYISKGYIYYIEGIVNPDKLKNLIHKFSKIYDIDRPAHTRFYNKSKGKCNCFFTCYPVSVNSEIKFKWYLLVTEGEGDIKNIENLLLVSDKHNRLNFEDEYEIAILPKKGSIPAFTWRMTKENYLKWRTRIIGSIRSKDDSSINQSHYSLVRCPGFRGIKKDVYELFKIFKNELIRTKSKSYKLEQFDFKKGYVRIYKDDFIDIELAIRNINKGNKFDYGFIKK